MAIDLIVSPLSKYWAGDYITPVMKEAWAIGADYKVFMPDGSRTLTEGTPYGGEGAKEEREEMVTFVEHIMKALPFEGAAGAWDEKSDHFGSHRVDPDAFGEFLKRADDQFSERPGFFGRLKGKTATFSHLASGLIFIPLDFDLPFDFNGKVFGSLHAAKRELDSGNWSGIPDEALQPIKDAFAEAKQNNFPLVFDV